MPRSESTILTRRPRVEPHLALLRTTGESENGPVPLPDTFRIATYNVHRWTGVRGGNAWHPERAMEVIATLGADVIALQEVLVPEREEQRQPLLEVADRLGYHVAFAVSRAHRHGSLGNAILARWPIEAALVVNLSIGRLEQRAALAVQFSDADDQPGLSVVATHLALVDRTRRLQVASLLEHPRLQGPTILLGDMNAWRDCRASRDLERCFPEEHHNRAWPPTFPAMRPMLALDRIYARGVVLHNLRAVNRASARNASDHLPIIAQAEILRG